MSDAAARSGHLSSPTPRYHGQGRLTLRLYCSRDSCVLVELEAGFQYRNRRTRLKRRGRTRSIYTRRLLFVFNFASNVAVILSIGFVCALCAIARFDGRILEQLDTAKQKQAYQCAADQRTKTIVAVLAGARRRLHLRLPVEAHR